jgi:hypothetical protein
MCWLSTATSIGAKSVAMKLWLIPVPSRLARPIVWASSFTQ